MTVTRALLHPRLASRLETNITKYAFDQRGREQVLYIARELMYKTRRGHVSRNEYTDAPTSDLL